MPGRKTTKTTKAKRVTSVKKTAGKKKANKSGKSVVKAGAQPVQPTSRTVAKHKLRLGRSIARMRDRVGASQMSQEAKEAFEAIYWDFVKGIAAQLPSMLDKNTKTISLNHARGALSIYATASGNDEFGDDLIRSGNKGVENYRKSLTA